MPLVFGDGQVVHTVPPAMPVVQVSPPAVPGLIVVPVIGPAGPPGASYRHDQVTAVTVWTIPHNLGRYPAAVMLYSPDLSVTYGAFVVQQLDINTLRVSMEIPTAGVALLI